MPAGWVDQDQKNKHLKKVSLSNGKGIDTNLFQYNESIFVSIELENNHNENYTPAVRVTDVFGNVLFTSWDKDSMGKNKKGKLETLICNIPAKLLKPSRYTLTIFVHMLDKNGKIGFEEANFDITVSAENCPIDLGRLGLLFPTLEWKRAPKEPS